MAEGEAKPAISFLEEHERAKASRALPAAPKPAPYVQPYRGPGAASTSNEAMYAAAMAALSQTSGQVSFSSAGDTLQSEALARLAAARQQAMALPPRSTVGGAPPVAWPGHAPGQGLTPGQSMAMMQPAGLPAAQMVQMLQLQLQQTQQQLLQLQTMQAAQLQLLHQQAQAQSAALFAVPASDNGAAMVMPLAAMELPLVPPSPGSNATAALNAATTHAMQHSYGTSSLQHAGLKLPSGWQSPAMAATPHPAGLSTAATSEAPPPPAHAASAPPDRTGSAAPAATAAAHAGLPAIAIASPAGAAPSGAAAIAAALALGARKPPLGRQPTHQQAPAQALAQGANDSFKARPPELRAMKSGMSVAGSSRLAVASPSASSPVVGPAHLAQSGAASAAAPEAHPDMAASSIQLEPAPELAPRPVPGTEAGKAAAGTAAAQGVVQERGQEGPAAGHGAALAPALVPVPEAEALPLPAPPTLQTVAALEGATLTAPAAAPALMDMYLSALEPPPAAAAQPEAATPTASMRSPPFGSHAAAAEQAATPPAAAAAAKDGDAGASPDAHPPADAPGGASPNAAAAAAALPGSPSMDAPTAPGAGAAHSLGALPLHAANNMPPMHSPAPMSAAATAAASMLPWSADTAGSAALTTAMQSPFMQASQVAAAAAPAPPNPSPSGALPHLRPAGPSGFSELLPPAQQQTHPLQEHPLAAPGLATVAVTMADGQGSMPQAPQAQVQSGGMHAAAAAAAAAAGAAAGGARDGGGTTSGGEGGTAGDEVDTRPAFEQEEEQLEAERKGMLVFGEEDEDGELMEEAPTTVTPWWRQKPFIVFCITNASALALAGIGVLLQTGVVQQSTSRVGVFRWLYFVALMPPIYYAVSFVMARVFRVVEWFFFRENLFYFASVQSSCTWLLLIVLMIPWYFTCFQWLWCDNGACSNSTYQQAVSSTWNTLLCVLLFCIGNLVKSVAAKTASTHFYRTAHFKKLKGALEKEYYLQVLSVPRSRVEEHYLQMATSKLGHSRSPSKGVISLLTLSRTPAAAGDGDAGAAEGQGQGKGKDPGSAAQAEAQDAADPPAAAAIAAAVETAAHAATNLYSATIGATIDAIRNAHHNANGNSAVPDGRSGASCGGPLGHAMPPCAPLHSLGGTVTSSGGDNLLDPSLRRRWQAAADAAEDAGVGFGVAPGPGPAPAAGTMSGALSVEPLPLQQEVSLAAIRVVVDGASSGSGREAGAAHAHSGASLPPPLEKVQELTTLPLSPPQHHRQQQLPAQQPRLLSAPAIVTSNGPPAGAHGATSAHAGVSLSSWGTVAVQPFLTHTSRQLDGALQPGGPSQGSGTLPPVARNGRNVRYGHHRAAQPPLPSLPRTAIFADGTRQALLDAMRPASMASGGANSASQPRRSSHSQGGGQQQQDRSNRNSGDGGRLRAITRLSHKPTSGGLQQGQQPAAPAIPEQLPQSAAADIGTEAYNAVPHQMKQQKAAVAMTEDELEKMRTAIVIKTYTALIRKHSAMSDEQQLRELKSVKRFARLLFLNVRGPDTSRDHFTMEDFNLFFATDPHMAKRAFEVFDTDKDGKVTMQEAKEAVVATYSERRNMARSLRDTDSIVQSLEFAIGVVIHFLLCALYLIIWGVPILEGFSAFSATVLALTFIFGNSARIAFESIIFLFWEHPYDVGDMVFFNNDSMRVKKINLMYTDFVKWTNEEIYVPNATLMGVTITNWTRTKTHYSLLKILVDLGVAWEVRQDIEAALQAHMTAPENASDFRGLASVTFREVVDPLKIYLGIGFTYNFQPDDFDRLVPARSKIMFVLQAKLHEHGLRFSNVELNRMEHAHAHAHTAAAGMGALANGFPPGMFTQPPPPLQQYIVQQAQAQQQQAAGQAQAQELAAAQQAADASKFKVD